MGADRISLGSLIGLANSPVEPVYLTLEDVQAIEEQVPNVRSADPSLNRRATVQHAGRQVEAELFADGAASLPLFMYEAYSVERGRFLTDDDNENRNQVAVIGPGLRQRLFPPGADPIGENITIDGVPFEVKGVLAPHRLATEPNYNAERAIALGTFINVPFRTAADELFPPDARMLIGVVVDNPARAEEIARDIHDLMYRRHGRGRNQLGGPQGAP